MTKLIMIKLYIYGLSNDGLIDYIEINYGSTTYEKNN
jgi:hypothetical protein